MKVRVFIIFFQLLQSLNSVIGQQGHLEHEFVPEKQLQFVQGIITKYGSFKNWFQAPLRKVEVVNMGEGNVLYKCRMKDSLILQLPSGEKILFYLHSSHHSEEIGDVTVGICSDGRVFLHSGHICGGIIHFVSKKGAKVLSSEDFFKNMIDDVDDKSWTPFNAAGDIP